MKIAFVASRNADVELARKFAAEVPETAYIYVPNPSTSEPEKAFVEAVRERYDKDWRKGWCEEHIIVTEESVRTIDFQPWQLNIWNAIAECDVLVALPSNTSTGSRWAIIQAIARCSCTILVNPSVTDFRRLCGEKSYLVTIPYWNDGRDERYEDFPTQEAAIACVAKYWDDDRDLGHPSIEEQTCVFNGRDDKHLDLLPGLKERVMARREEKRKKQEAERASDLEAKRREFERLKKIFEKE